MFRFLAIFLLVLTGCIQSTITADSQKNSDPQPLLDEPQKTALCQLKNDPASYNHKLIEVTGFISHGFENSSIFEPDCKSNQGIWVEYGGTTAAGTMYCCGVSAERRRTEPLIVEDITTSMLEDEQFHALDKLLQKRPDSIARATVIGRFFAGEVSKYSTDNLWSGYGHRGCCSLLVIQKIVSVEPHDQNDLDYRASADQPVIKNGGGYKILRSKESAIEWQQNAEIEKKDWVFNNPHRVAAESLAKLLKIDEESVKEVKQTAQSQGRFIYQWRNKAAKTDYMVVVSRPYWLSFYAKERQKTAWIVIGAYELR